MDLRLLPPFVATSLSLYHRLINFYFSSAVLRFRRLQCAPLPRSTSLMLVEAGLSSSYVFKSRGISSGIPKFYKYVPWLQIVLSKCC